MTDYIPVDKDLRQDCLQRKHEEYTNLLKHYFGRPPTIEDTVDDLTNYSQNYSAYENKNFK